MLIFKRTYACIYKNNITTNKFESRAVLLRNFSVYFFSLNVDWFKSGIYRAKMGRRFCAARDNNGFRKYSIVFTRGLGFDFGNTSEFLCGIVYWRCNWDLLISCPRGNWNLNEVYDRVHEIIYWNSVTTHSDGIPNPWQFNSNPGFVEIRMGIL